VLAAKFATTTKIYGFSARHATTQNGRDMMAVVFALAGQISAAHSVVTHGTDFPGVLAVKSEPRLRRSRRGKTTSKSFIPAV